MTRLLAGATLVLFWAAPSPAQDSPEVPWANKLFEPAETKPVVVNDFGIVPKGQLLIKKYAVTNPYKVPLAVEVRPPSCSCVSARFSKDALQPLETGELLVTMDANRFTGDRTVRLPVHFRSGDNTFFSTAALQFQAHSRADITLGAPGSIQFGVVGQRAKAAQTIEVVYSGTNAQWKITEADAGSAPVDVSFEVADRTRTRAVYRVTARLKEGAPDGPIEGRVELRTNDSSTPLIAISLSGAVQAPFTVIGGPKIELPTTSVGGPVEGRNVLIRGQRPFKIDRVEGEKNGLRVEYGNVPAKQVQSLALKFEPSYAGTLNQEVKVLLSTGDVVTFLVHGEAVAK